MYACVYVCISIIYLQRRGAHGTSYVCTHPGDIYIYIVSPEYFYLQSYPPSPYLTSRPSLPVSAAHSAIVDGPPTTSAAPTPCV